MKVKEIKAATNNELIDNLIYYSGHYNNGVMSNATMTTIERIKKELLKRFGEEKSYTTPSLEKEID